MFTYKPAALATSLIVKRMARGRGSIDETGTRPATPPDFSKDPVSFRAWWQQKDFLTRQSYVWPQELDNSDLSGLDLSDTDLSGRSLIGADLSGANLRGANLAYADIRSAKLAGTEVDQHTDLSDVTHDGLYNDTPLSMIINPPDEISKVRNTTIATYNLSSGGKRIAEYDGDNLLASPRRIIYLSAAGKDGKEVYHRADGPAVVDYYEDGSLRSHEYYQNGTRSRSDGPAFEEWYTTGIKARESYYVDGLPNRNFSDEPVSQSWWPEGHLKRREYGNDKGIHRSGDEPALESWHRNGEKESEGYYKHGRVARDSKHGPAVAEWDSAGNPEYIEYRDIEGRLHHNADRPARATYHPNGQVETAEYYKDGELHRDPILGAALITYSRSGKIISETFFVDGNIVDNA